MFNKKELKELNGKYSILRNRITDLENEINRKTSIIVQFADYDYSNFNDDSYRTAIIGEKRVSIKHILKELLTALGYEIIYKHEKEEYLLKKKSKKRKE